MRSDRRRRGSAGRRALSLLLVLMATLVALQIVTRPAPTPILATVPLHLDPAAAVDVVLDGRAGRLLVVNAGLAQAFDTRTGVRVYATRTGTAYAQGIESPPPVVDERSGRVYVPNLVDDAVYVFDGRSGRPLPPLRVGHRPDLLALDDRRGRLLVASTADWTLTVLDARTGVTLHTRSLDVGDRPGQLVADSGSGHTFVAGDGGQLSTVASGTGHLVRRVAPNPAHDVTALAVDARARRVLGLVEARPDVVVLDTRTGAAVRTVSVGRSLDAIVVNARTGRAFLADSGAGAVHVLGHAPRRYVRTVRVGAEPLVAVDARRQRVVVASATGLSVLDARSGRVRRRAPLALDADALVVDERTGHVFIVSVGGTQALPSPWATVLDPLRRWFPTLPAPAARLRTEPSLLRILDEARL